MYVEHRVQHFQQRFSWDCGVACVVMSLSTEQRKHLLDNFNKICHEEGFQRTTWTIDLCYLLKRFGITHSMYTTLKGVSNKTVYSEKIKNQERLRIEKRFANTTLAGIEVHERALTNQELIAHVASRGPAIVLVDGSLLVCDICKRNKLTVELRRAFGSQYRGHYVMVVGVSGNKMVYRDPALSDQLCASAPSRFQDARLSPGTDLDLILIHKDYR